MLTTLLRVIGTASGLAIFAVVLPYDWMNRIHLSLGMGTLPPDPIAGYLARTLSALYVFYGGLVWTLSFDTTRHRSIIQYVGLATIAFGVILLGVDWTEGMPFYWKLLEGPVAIVYGVLILLFNREETG